jgi:hypothetical protein
VDTEPLRQTTHVYGIRNESILRTKVTPCSCRSVQQGRPLVRGADGSMGGEDERSQRHHVAWCIGVDPEPSGDIILSARMLTFVWCFAARKSEEPPQGGKQMGTVPWTVYAPTRRKEHWKLPDGMSWQTVPAHHGLSIASTAGYFMRYGAGSTSGTLTRADAG